jgi:hypothetical protein
MKMGVNVPQTYPKLSYPKFGGFSGGYLYPELGYIDPKLAYPKFGGFSGGYLYPELG